MSLVWLDGFDSYGDTQGTDVNPTDILSRYYEYALDGTRIEVGDGRVYGNSVVATYGSGYQHFKTYSLGNTSGTPQIIGFGLKLTKAPSGDLPLLACFDQNGNTNCELRIDPAGHFCIYRRVAVLLATSSDYVKFNEWCYFEMQFEISETATVIMRLNGKEILNESGLNTKYDSGATNADQWGFCNCCGDTYYDDLYILNKDGVGLSDFLGPIVITTVRPNGDDTTDWTPSTGTTHYDLVNKSQSSDTTYVATGTPGNYDIYDYGNLIYSEDIKGIAIKSECYEDAAGTEDIHNMIESGAATSDGSGTTVDNTEYSGVVRYSEEDPNTSSAWTPTNLDAAKFGVKHG